MRETVPREMKPTLHSVQRTTRRHQGRHCVQYQTCTSQDEGRNATQGNNKGLHHERHHKVIPKWCFKDGWNFLKMYTSVFYCGALKKKMLIAESFFLSKTLSPSKWHFYNFGFINVTTLTWPLFDVTHWLQLISHNSRQEKQRALHMMSSTISALPWLGLCIRT